MIRRHIIFTSNKENIIEHGVISLFISNIPFSTKNRRNINSEIL